MKLIQIGIKDTVPPVISFFFFANVHDTAGPNIFSNP